MKSSGDADALGKSLDGRDDWARPTPGRALSLHMRQPCGCGLYLHGHSWEHIIEHDGAEFVYCAKHAAAPALLAALTEIAAYGEPFKDEDDNTCRPWLRTDGEVRKIARAAIAKATEGGA